MKKASQKGKEKKKALKKIKTNLRLFCIWFFFLILFYKFAFVYLLFISLKS